MLLCNINAVL